MLREENEQQRNRAGESLNEEDRPLRRDRADDPRDDHEAEEQDLDRERTLVRYEPPDQPRGDEQVVHALIRRERRRVLRLLRRQPEDPPPGRLGPEKRFQNEEAGVQQRDDPDEDVGDETHEEQSTESGVQVRVKRYTSRMFSAK